MTMELSAKAPETYRLLQLPTIEGSHGLGLPEAVEKVEEIRVLVNNQENSTRDLLANLIAADLEPVTRRRNRFQDRGILCALWRTEDHESRWAVDAVLDPLLKQAHAVYAHRGNPSYPLVAIDADGLIVACVMARHGAQF